MYVFLCVNVDVCVSMCVFWVCGCVSCMCESYVCVACVCMSVCVGLVSVFVVVYVWCVCL